jgi:hypothetical protein
LLRAGSTERKEEKMRAHQLMTLFILLAPLASACHAAGADDAQPEQADDPTKGDVVAPLGTFGADKARAGELSTLTLRADGTFARTVEKGASATGTFRLTHSETTHFIRFLDAEEALIDRYAWVLTGDSLRLRPAGEMTSFTLTRAAGSVDGQRCGGIAGLACPEGMVCEGAAIADKEGVCRQTCGGLAGIACPADLTCVLAASSPDAKGTCR